MQYALIIRSFYENPLLRIRRTLPHTERFVPCKSHNIFVGGSRGSFPILSGDPSFHETQRKDSELFFLGGEEWLKRMEKESTPRWAGNHHTLTWWFPAIPFFLRLEVISIHSTSWSLSAWDLSKRVNSDQAGGGTRIAVESTSEATAGVHLAAAGARPDPKKHLGP